MSSAYEQERLRNIEKNKQLLQELGLDKPLFEPKEKKAPKKAKTAPKKRKEPPVDTHDAEVTPMKAPRQSLADTSSEGVRRSGRNAGKKVNYAAEQESSSRDPESFRIHKDLPAESGNGGPLGRSAGSKRIHDPKSYGSIPGVAVGTWWETRQACSDDAVHAPWVAGIAPGPQGAYSVALSGGYEDDVDLGYAFTYTGSGGRDLKGTKANPKNLRTAPQSKDQSFEENFNKSLKKSSETKKPIRVIRGYKLKSKYGPSEGYRYDGLYTVEKAWMENGLNAGGFKVCKFAFKRISGQAPLPVKGLADDDENDVAEDEEKEAFAEDADVASELSGAD